MGLAPRQATAATSPEFNFWLGGEGVAENPRGFCGLRPGVVQCVVHYQGARCTVATRLTITLPRTGPARRSTTCAAVLPEGMTGGGVRWKRGGFTCQLLRVGVDVAAQTILQCVSPTRRGFETNTPDFEQLTPALLSKGGRTIVLGKGIGPVRLGQTVAAVRTLMSAPAKVSQFIWSSTGQPGLRMEFNQAYGDFAVSFGNRRVVSIHTTSPRYRTPGGIGPQQPMALAAALPGSVFSNCSGGYLLNTSGASTDFLPQSFNDAIALVGIDRAGWVTC